MKRLALLGAAALVAACSDGGGSPRSEDQLALSGGATTVFDQSSAAFSSPAANLVGDRLARHVEGDASFEATFVTAPAPVHPGLGPLFIASSCRACHVADGRGQPPGPGEIPTSLLFRLSIPGADPNGGPLAAGGYGTQLQVRAVSGFIPEAGIDLQYTDSSGNYGDGMPFALKVPAYTVTNPYTALPGGLLMSPRMAPPVFGLGLLEAVSDATILSHADPVDANGDGISGRANQVWDPTVGHSAIGRFGWKANTASLKEQVAAAYSGDMGVTSSAFPIENCHQTQANCPDGVQDLPDDLLALTTFYVQTLGVPARRSLNVAAVRRGTVLFERGRCSACHLPNLRTASLVDVPEVSDQRIQPYTDLLLHDMGPGLADGRPDFDASGSEWRTAPLWGIGLTATVNGHTRFLHDGRAGSLAEAVLWHGGEATASREFFRTLAAADRAALIAFLSSL